MTRSLSIPNGTDRRTAPALLLQSAQQSLPAPAPYVPHPPAAAMCGAPVKVDTVLPGVEYPGDWAHDAGAGKELAPVRAQTPNIPQVAKIAAYLPAVVALWATHRMMAQELTLVFPQRARKEVENQRAAETKNAVAHSRAQEVDRSEVRQSEEVAHFLDPAQYLAPAWECLREMQNDTRPRYEAFQGQNGHSACQCWHRLPDHRGSRDPLLPELLQHLVQRSAARCAGLIQSPRSLVKPGRQEWHAVYACIHLRSFFVRRPLQQQLSSNHPCFLAQQYLFLSILGACTIIQGFLFIRRGVERAFLQSGVDIIAPD